MTSISPLPLSMIRKSGSLVFVSGQLALLDGKIVGDDITAQTGYVIDAIERQLATLNLNLGNVIKTSVWLVNADDFSGFNTAYAARFAAPYPARSTVISQLAIAGALVEIDAVAELASDVAR